MDWLRGHQKNIVVRILIRWKKVACSKNLPDLVMIMMTELLNLRTAKEKVSLTTENGQKPCSRNWNWFEILTWKRAEHEKMTRSSRNISRLNLNLDNWETTAQLYGHTDCHRHIIGAFPGEMNESIITTKEILRKTYFLISEGFLSETMTNHGAAGKETDHLNSSLPSPPACKHSEFHLHIFIWDDCLVFLIAVYLNRVIHLWLPQKNLKTRTPLLGLITVLF